MCNISYTMKVKFCCSGQSVPLLAKCYATDGPNQKSHKGVWSALMIMTGFIMMLKMIRSDALTAPMHLNTVHTTLSTEH